MGKDEEDRIAMLVLLANLERHPESVPISLWQLIGNTSTEAVAQPVEPFSLVRALALARILMPESVVCLSAGRAGISDELQALCFLSGANSIFVGDVLLTTGNPASWQDANLFARLGMRSDVVQKAFSKASRQHRHGTAAATTAGLETENMIRKGRSGPSDACSVSPCSSQAALACSQPAPAGAVEISGVLRSARTHLEDAAWYGLQRLAWVLHHVSGSTGAQLLPRADKARP